MRLVALFALSIALGGCRPGCSGSTPAATADAAPDAPTLTSPATAASAGPAFIGTLGGITVVEGGVVKAVDGVKESVTHLSLAPDGTVFASATNILRVRDGRATETPLTSIASAVGPDGKVFMPALDAHIHVLDGDAASDMDFPEVPYHVAVTARGTVFAAGSESVYRRDDASWKKVDLEEHVGNRPRLLGLRAGPTGELYVITEDAVVRRSADGTLAKVDLGPLAGVFHHGDVSSKGVLPLATREGLRLVAADGSVNAVGSTLKPSDVTAVAIDDAGRLWVGAGSGLHVLSGDGKVLQSWLPGALPSHAAAIAVRGSGPALPEKAPEPVTGSVKARVTREGKPLARSEIEICATPTFADTPCAMAAVRFSGKTDENGGFTFTGVPRQRYRLAFKAGSAWKFALSWGIDKDCCADLAAGEVRDLGDVVVR